MNLVFFNTLSRKEEELRPLDPKHVRIYVCGPTVYDRPHLGNARSVVVYDVIYRLLRKLYPKVTYIRNITDVDDKINAAAKANNESIDSLTARITGFFHSDMDALNVLRPSIEPRATDHIKDMIEMITKLIDREFAYIAEGHVLFDVTKDKNYGKLSRRSQKEMIAGARVEVAPYKKNPADFVLWKPKDQDDDPSSIFQSPWGEGRPGWHIECSAMSTRYLGQDFDIHGGGADLMFPHHENEIAQSCSASPGSDFARMWVHNGFLTVNGEKMAKSLGNFITVRDLLDKGINGEVIRLALLSSHYRSPLDWSDKLLEDSKKTLDYLYRGLGLEVRGQKSEISKELLDCLNKDLNISSCLAKIHEAVREKRDLSGVFNFCRDVLGILHYNSESWFKNNDEDVEYIDDMIKARKIAKNLKNWAEADRIRKELLDKSIILEDRPDGATYWRKA